MIAACLRHPGRTLLGVGLISSLLGSMASRVAFDNTPSAWLLEADEELAVYDRFRARFGEDSFVLAATDDLDLDSPETQAAILLVQAELGELPGVERVLSPLSSGGRVELARERMAGELDRLERALELAPEDPELLLLAAELNASLPFLLWDGEERALACYRRAQALALQRLEQLAPGLAGNLSGVTSSLEPAQLLDEVGPGALPPAFFWAFARGAEARASGFSPQVLTDLPRVDATMRWVLERDERFFEGGGHLYLAIRHAALPRALGGDPDRALPHFDRLEELSGGHALLPHVLLAELYAPTLAATPAGTPLPAVIAAQRHAWERYRSTLVQVLAAPADFDKHRPLANAVARQRARTLLLDPEAHGVILAEGERTPPLPAELTSWLREDDLLTGHLVSEDHQRLALVVVPQPGLPPQARAGLVEGVRSTMQELGVVYLAGPDVITHELDLGSQTSFARLFPLVVVMMAIVLIASLRSLWATLAILLAAGLAGGWTVGVISLSGCSLNMILVLIPAVLAVLTAAYSLHLVARYLHLPQPAGPLSREGRLELWLVAAGHTLRPCALTALATAVGFLSLLSSEIPPVRQLGLFTALGVACAFGLTFVLVPVLLSLVPGVLPKPQEQRWWTREGVSGFTRWLLPRAGSILALTGCLLILSLFAIANLRVESHILRFFPEQHRLPQSYAEIEGSLTGLTPLELWLSGPLEEVAQASTLQALERFLGKVDRGIVLDVLSPLGDAAGRVLSPAARAALLRATVQGELPAEAQHYLVGADGRLDLRVTLACRTTSSDAHHELTVGLRRELEASGFGPAVEAHLTGAVPLLVRVQVLLVRTQLHSFGLALLLVTLILAAAFRSAKLVLISLLPNVLPILLTLGVMGATGIPLSTATVTVAGIALGLVVHDTIHLLHEYVVAQSAAGTRREQVEDALLVVGRPILTTSLAVALGFGAFVVSPFRPTLFFGLLIGLTALAALVCDLVVLPALLLVSAGRRERT